MSGSPFFKAPLSLPKQKRDVVLDELALIISDFVTKYQTYTYEVDFWSVMEVVQDNEGPIRRHLHAQGIIGAGSMLGDVEEIVNHQVPYRLGAAVEMLWYKVVNQYENALCQQAWGRTYDSLTKGPGRKPLEELPEKMVLRMVERAKAIRKAGRAA